MLSSADAISESVGARPCVAIMCLSSLCNDLSSIVLRFLASPFIVFNDRSKLDLNLPISSSLRKNVSSSC